jgi:hypothetical protein
MQPPNAKPMIRNAIVRVIMTDLLLRPPCAAPADNILNPNT